MIMTGADPRLTSLTPPQPGSARGKGGRTPGSAITNSLGVATGAPSLGGGLVWRNHRSS
jgi:hypothetical protein